MILKDPFVFIFLPLLLGLAFWSVRRRRDFGLRFPSRELVNALPRTWKIRFAGVPFYFRLLALIFLVVALSGPRLMLQESKHETEGIDIVLAIDGSGSMAAEDFTLKGRRYNRLEVVKDVVKEFIDGRNSDRIGLVAFGGLAYTVSPLTTDYAWLKMNLERVTLNMMEDGTAIGSAISASLSRLQKSQAKSKVIILLTDGVNNHGKIDPVSAAKAAQAFGVKIYTIGAGTNGMAPYPVQDIWGRQGYQSIAVEIDEQTLQTIASVTGGKYFRATDTDSLRQVYKEIDHLEKTKIIETGYREYKELFGYFLGTALVFLLAALVLENTLLLCLP